MAFSISKFISTIRNFTRFRYIWIVYFDLSDDQTVNGFTTRKSSTDRGICCVGQTVTWIYLMVIKETQGGADVRSAVESEHPRP